MILLHRPQVVLAVQQVILLTVLLILLTAQVTHQAVLTVLPTRLIRKEARDESIKRRD